MTDAGRYALIWPDFSDGDVSKWPKDGKCKRADHSSVADGWKDKIGHAIAAVLKYPYPENYHMIGWPSNYAVFVTTRGSGVREDYYIYGGPTKYRSAKDFAHKAVWLYCSGNPPQGYEEIVTEVFSGKSSNATKDSKQEPVDKTKKANSKDKNIPPDQTRLSEELLNVRPDISRKVTFHQRSHSEATASSGIPRSPSPSSLPSVQRGLNVMDPIVNHTSLHSSELPPDLNSEQTRPLDLLLTIHPVIPTTSTFPTREQLIRPSRKFRIGELVWCAIDPPLCRNEPAVVIDYWPGVIAGNRVKKSSKRTSKVHETAIYEVKLLALDESFVLPEASILLYKIYYPKQEIVRFFQTHPPLSTTDIPNKLYHFKRLSCLLNQEAETNTDEKVPENPFDQAIGPFSLALQNAAHLSLTWGFLYPHDEQYLSFSAIWIGPELIFIEEVAILVCSRHQLSMHKSMQGVAPKSEDDGRAVLLQVQHIEARPVDINGRKGGRGILIGPLYELVPILSNNKLDALSSMPKQPPPFGMAWKRILPQDYIAHVDIQYIAGRYHDEDVLTTQALETDPRVIAALQGLAPGYCHGGPNFPTSYHNTRAEMARDAERRALNDLVDFWSNQQRK